MSQGTDNLRDSHVTNVAPPTSNLEANGKDPATPDSAKEEKRAKYQSPSLHDLTFEYHIVN